ncbi:DNA gyrase subunit A [Desulfuribacillus stibiiarsenatis]|uniref:DNA gyrase subunit A n=1 Tax=Desulfuribacillus stibiiarsenatis TaxID=1390249 RepID=A0A1E5L8J4_9FIRM|nr:DNA gyrase subunit A [Desulfuribacillus stibiiarsenatis]OEH86470.1 DNA gyrase subunit A [Desulfuribacillus stibiiarsenatis]
MEEQSSKVLPINISDEMRNSFMDYAMSVIVSRALPDVRDGLKPVHRRILYAMNELGMTPDKPYKKSARLVGDVIGKYHPHGDQAVYDTMVRMAQDFSYRYMLVDGHGNFGSVDGDAAAAMRYTESRMSKIAVELLRDIQKETVNYGSNYDDTLKEPLVLPSRFPNILVNGASGIAVGMATNIPPHQLGEVIDGCVAYIEDNDITIDELMEYVKGPDFPTGGEILGQEGIRSSYRTGRGSVIMRAKAHFEDMNHGKQRIIVTEIPYQVNKARLIEKIAELVRDKKIDGITDLRDESDREGMRIVIELRRDANGSVVLNNLYKQTQLQSSFGVNMLALVDGEPKVLNLKQIIHYYIEHQKEIIRRRSEFDLRKAKARAHILEGLRIALDHLDAVIKLIRASDTVENARIGLMETFHLSEEQAKAILDMRLQKLTGLEREKIEEEYAELLKLIEELEAILADEAKILAIIKKELLEIKDQFNDKRRSIITQNSDEIDIEDLIPEEDVVITLTHYGYVKRIPVSTYKSQKRGGKGVSALGTKESDFLQHLFMMSTHDYVLFFTNRGKVYRLKAYEIPEGSRTAKGTAIVNLLQIEPGEMINAMIPVRCFKSDSYLFMATKKGQVKKTELTDFQNIRKGGLIAITLRPEDELIGVFMTDGSREIIIGSKKGKAIRFQEKEVRQMGRTASGVRGISLAKDDVVVDIDVVVENEDVIVITENGYGKRTKEDEYRPQTRGGKGIGTINVTDKNGPVVGLKIVNDQQEVMVITQSGIVIRQDVKGISQLGRRTQGVRIIRVGDNDKVSTFAKIIATEDVELDEE